MNISRSAFLAMVILNAGLIGSSLRQILAGETGASETAPPERGTIDHARIPIIVKVSSSASEDLAQAVTIEVRDDSVTMTVAGPRAPCPPFGRCDGPTLLQAAALREPGPSFQQAWPPSSEPDSQRRQLTHYGSARDLDWSRAIAANGPEVAQRWWKLVPAQIFAMNGSVIMVGDGGRLIANTGPASAGGVVALGVEGSQLSTGASAPPAVGAGWLLPTAGGTGSRGLALAEGPLWSAAEEPGSWTARLPARFAGGGDGGHTPADPLAPPVANMSFLGTIPRAGKSKGMGVSISGFEDHSVSVRGNDQIVTYDDSNVFLDRNGEINANTGDTDSSGLNVVDVTGSWIRSGNSGDSERGTEADEQKAPRKTAPQSPSSGAQDVSALRFRSGPGRPRRAILGFAPGPMNGLTMFQPADEEGEADAGIRPPPLRDGQSFAAVPGEGTPAALGNTTFVVGDDGFDDISIRSSGDRNIITYDDSNLVVGGTGRVNAQIGDSDTGGTVVMGVHSSSVEGGCEGDQCGPAPTTRPESPESEALSGQGPPSAELQKLRAPPH